ncbi:MAG TPA: hypothetical protein VGV89_10805 [Thermoplasmata archaeon]|nr:hypothetical protein [Thermoplasmata archaeon]
MSFIGRFRHALAVGASVAFVLLLVGSAAGSPGTTSPGGSAGTGASSGLTSQGSPPASGATFTVPLTVGSRSVNLSSEFWGTTVNNEVHMLRGETDAVNATPSRVLVFPGAMAGEDYDPITNTHYDTYSGVPKTALTSEAQFVRMCEATHCTAILQVPAEIDNPAYAEKIVNYTERNLSFVPAFWMIGNEPELWSHWQVPWSKWEGSYTGGPTPAQFGAEVVAYVHAIRHVDNTTPILGLPASGCTCGYWTFSQWISGVLNVTGPLIQAVAFHEYPAGWLGTGDGSLHDFYGTIQGAASIPVRILAARQAVVTSCPKCNVSVFVSELGSALSWSAYGQYAAGFSGALSLASQITQSMDVNLTNVDLFAAELATTNSWFGPDGYARPDYALYTSVFDHLGTQAFPVNLTGLDHTLYGIDTIAPRDDGRRDLLVVNDNITNSITFAPQFAEGASSAPVEAWSWNGSIHATSANATTWVEPYTPGPVPAVMPQGLPSAYTLPPQSMVLFEQYPSGASYVEVHPTGVPNGTPWYASVGSQFYRSDAGNLTLLLPNGTYSVQGAPIALPIGGKELVPTERLAAFDSTPLTVDGSFTNYSFGFVPQWRVNGTPVPAVGGTVSPSVGWWNQSAPLHLTVSNPAPGFAFTRWAGFGPGNYSGTNRTITVVPTGPVREAARFVPGLAVRIVESGLPPGTPWTASVRNFTFGSNSTNVTLWQPNGTYGFSLSSVPGYRSVPANGGFTVAGASVEVPVRYMLITPPQPLYRIAFQVSGLPAGLPVSVTVRGANQSDLGGGPSFDLYNGSYAYQVGYVPGYHVAVNKTFEVAGGAMVIQIPFVPTTYAATWEVDGARPWMNWAVDVDGTQVWANSSWVGQSLANGTYAYSIQLPYSNFTVTPRTGELVVDGYGGVLPISFVLEQFPTWFEERGLTSGSGWSVRLGNDTLSTSAPRSEFLTANGTYTFSVLAPSGFYAVPSHGTFTVAGSRAPLVISFQPSSDRPSAALVAALDSGALSVSIWIGLSIVGGFATVRWLRRRGD